MYPKAVENDFDTLVHEVLGACLSASHSSSSLGAKWPQEQVRGALRLVALRETLALSSEPSLREERTI